MKEHYLRVLNLPATASEREIKRAYRRLAKRYHPDCSPDPAAHDRFIEVTEAYQYLTDPDAPSTGSFTAHQPDPFAQEQERRRSAARQFAQQEAEEMLRRRIVATVKVNRSFGSYRIAGSLYPTCIYG